MDWKGRRQSQNVVDMRAESKRNMLEENTRVLNNIKRKNENPNTSGWIKRDGVTPDLSKGRRWDPAKDSVYENWE